jgi:hypothetical protein
LLLLMSRQDELTVQVPSTLPPQAETFMHWLELPPEPVDPPLCELPPEPVDPPLCELPPVPVWLLLAAQAAAKIPKAIANGRTGAWTFIEISLESESKYVPDVIAPGQRVLSEKDAISRSA